MACCALKHLLRRARGGPAPDAARALAEARVLLEEVAAEFCALREAVDETAAETRADLAAQADGARETVTGALATLDGLEAHAEDRPHLLGREEPRGAGPSWQQRWAMGLPLR